MLSVTKKGIMLVRDVAMAAAIVIFVSMNMILQSTLPIAGIPFLGATTIGVTMFLLLISEVSNNRFESGDIFGLVLFGISVIVALNSRNNNLAAMMAFVFVARNHDFRFLAKVFCATVTITFAFIVIASTFGFGFNFTWLQGDRVREGLGFKYATYGPHYYMYAVLLLIFATKGRLNPWVIFCLMAIDVILFLKTDTRNSFTLTLLALAVCLFCRKWLSKDEPYSAGAVCWSCICPLIAVASIALMVFYDPSATWMLKLDGILGHRLDLSHTTYLNAGVEPFGQYVSMVGNGVDLDMVQHDRSDGNPFIDNSYCSALVRYGLIALTGFIVLYACAMFNAARKGDRISLMIFAIIAVHSAIDPWWLTLQYDGFLLLAGLYAMRKGEDGRCVVYQDVVPFQRELAWRVEPELLSS